MPSHSFFSRNHDGSIALPDIWKPYKRRKERNRKTRFPWHHHGGGNGGVQPVSPISAVNADVVAPVKPPLPRRSSLPEKTAFRKAVSPSPEHRPQLNRQESERRENLLKVPARGHERRTSSLDGNPRAPLSRMTSPNAFPPLTDRNLLTQNLDRGIPERKERVLLGGENAQDETVASPIQLNDAQSPRISEAPQSDFEDGAEYEEQAVERLALQDAYDRKWILNLSMQFRDGTSREKFFVTYAETSTKWRRVTLTLDYRNAPEGSLEADLHTLHYQRDKSFRIFEAIHESLPEVHYFDTVTNLKLETTPEDGQLHIYVREDGNEVTHFPECSLFKDIDVPYYRESQIEFIAHLSGFVYKVSVEGRILVKKEIPGPDMLDEFMYEVNALDALRESSNVVRLEGLVTDEAEEVVKGLLLAYLPRGALVDMLYDYPDTTQLPWHRREKWALHTVRGLADVHEAGFVQGDFTMSNIVIDDADNAHIIDINRRGCPVGWEPPELCRMIENGQRISMCIGVKTDLFQLGMVLWALAELVESPERLERPLPRLPSEVPAYYRHIVEICLSERPQERRAATDLLRLFPHTAGTSRPGTVEFVDPVVPSPHRTDKEYIDPEMAVTLDDVDDAAGCRRRSRRSADEYSPFTSGQVTYFEPRAEGDRMGSSNPASTGWCRIERPASIAGVDDPRGRSRVSSGCRGRKVSSSPSSLASSATRSCSRRRRRRRSPPSRSRRMCLSSGSEEEDERLGPAVVVPHPAPRALRSSRPPTATAGRDFSPFDRRGKATERAQDVGAASAWPSAP